MKKNRYRIVHVAFKHSPDDNRIFRKQCLSLAKNSEYEVMYITSDINRKEQVDSQINVKRIVIPANPKRIVRQFVYLRQLRKIIHEINKEKHIDIIEIHEITLLPLAYYFMGLGIKVIFDSHEDYYKQIESRHGKFAASIYKFVEKRICKKIDACIFPCMMLEDGPFDYGVKRIVYIDNYPIVNEEELIFKTNNDEFIACYTGTISYARGVFHAVQSWGKSNTKGIIAGRYSDAEIKSKIENLENYNNVEFKGWIDPEQLGDIYSKVSVGMSNLLNRGQYHKSCNFPTKALEYMMYGIPVIIYKNSFVEEVLMEYEFGVMVDPENVEEMANVLTELKNNPQKALKMGRNGMKAVRERFNWSTQEEKLFKLYKELLEE